MKRFFVAVKNIFVLLMLPIIVIPVVIYGMREEGELKDVLSGKIDIIE